MTPGQRRRPAESASAAGPPRWRAVGACRAAGEGHGPEERKRGRGRHRRWGRGSGEGILGLGLDQTVVTQHIMDS